MTTFKSCNLFLLCILSAGTILISFGCSPQKTAIPDTVREGLQGPVKRVLLQHENAVWTNNQIIDRRLEIQHEDQYDRDGYKTHHQMFTWIDTPVNGKPYGNHPGGVWKSFLNGEGYRIRTEVHTNAGKIDSYFYQYRDINGNIFYEMLLDKDKKRILEWIVERDDRNKVDIATVKNASGTITGTGYWYYDDRGLYIQKANAELDENVWSYIYDATGTLRYFQQTDFGMNQKVIRYHAEMYGSNGQKQFKYDRDILNNNNYYRVFDYEVDKYSNWISEAEYVLTRKNGQDQKVLVRYSFRDIEYYED